MVGSHFDKQPRASIYKLINSTSGNHTWANISTATADKTQLATNFMSTAKYLHITAVSRFAWLMLR